jgi:hypothetical protein
MFLVNWSPSTIRRVFMAVALTRMPAIRYQVARRRRLLTAKFAADWPSAYAPEGRWIFDDAEDAQEGRSSGQDLPNLWSPLRLA